MFRDTVLWCIAIVTIVWITLTSGEPCAHDVRLIQNQTGYYVTWSRLGDCGDSWIRTDKNADSVLVSSPMLIQLGSNPRVICRNKTCEVTNINVTTATSTVWTTRPTTSDRLVTTSSRNVPTSNTVTPAPRGPVNEFPTLLVAVSVCSIVVLTVVVILVVFLVKTRRTQPDKTAAPVVNSTRSLRREDIQHMVSTDEPGIEEGTYTEIGAVSHPPRDLYAVVVKKQDIADTSAVEDAYAVVQKPPKESGHTADPGSMYAEVQKPSNGKRSPIQKPSNAAKQPMLQEDTNGPNQDGSRHKNKDGLIYLDVDFSQTPDQKEGGHPLLDCPQRDCDYAEVQHT
ncbi:uncharacterized protein LOC110446569 isoform X2 [Mizuhopecten yessoensis]|uniref:uncharacterized protein LOC110446569 isoform X2 n=1 Tax=Mizuhopecten yessoensis TaxID=6573 RepID=UPI000B45C861|nr:uncharacterized protein LOC110446569 isoform X2 [Mizuhopecten yessoensis]